MLRQRELSFLQESQAEDEKEREFSPGREVQCCDLWKWQCNGHDIKGDIETCCCPSNSVGVDTSASMLAIPTLPGQVERLALEDEAENEADHEANRHRHNSKNLISKLFVGKDAEVEELDGDL